MLGVEVALAFQSVVTQVIGAIAKAHGGAAHC